MAKNYYIGKFDEGEANRSTRIRAFGRDEWANPLLILTPGHFAKELERHQKHMRQTLANPKATTEYINMVGNYMIYYMLKLGREDKVIEFRNNVGL